MKQDWTDKLKDKMDGYTESPSGRVWEGISSGLSADGRSGKKPRVIPPWLWKGAVAAAAAIAGVFIMFKVNDDGTVPMTAYVSDSAMQSSEQRLVTESRGISIDINRERPASKSVRHALPCEVTFAEESIDRSAYAKESTGLQERPVQKMKAVTEETGDNYGSEAEAWAEYLANEEPGRKRRTGKFSASISANGSGSGHSSESRQSSGVMGANPLESGLSSADWVDKDFKGVNNFVVYNRPETETRYTHKMPVRISATARYEFSERFGIESGLSWSVLSSELRTGDEGSGDWTHGEQTLHYIGVPLNLSLKLYQSRFFTAYVTAGGMMEVPVRGTLKSDEYADGKFIRTASSSLRPKELQWSVNAAAGAQLNILPQLGLFVEPGVSHRFSNGSKIRSAYTDRPTDFSLGFGLRYSFSKK